MVPTAAMSAETLTHLNSQTLIGYTNNDHAIYPHGEVVYEGSAEQLVQDPKAREIYLGPEFNM